MPNDVPSPYCKLAGFTVKVQMDLIFIIAFIVYVLI